MKAIGTLLRPVQRWIWRDSARRARKLLRFAETEADGGRDLVRAAELTSDPVLRRLYLFHAEDEQRHADLFRQQGAALARTIPPRSRAGLQRDGLTPGERGLDDLRIEDETDGSLLAFLHLSEKSAAAAFGAYRDLLTDDPSTQAVFTKILSDEAHHVAYTFAQLSRLSSRRPSRLLWSARLNRLWKGYVRLAAALAGLVGTAFLTVEYFVLLPPFALLAKRAAAREGWIPVLRGASLKRQY